MAFSFLAVLRDLRAILKGEGVGLDQPKEAVVQCEPLADVHRGPTVSAMLPSRTAEPKKSVKARRLTPRPLMTYLYSSRFEPEACHVQRDALAASS